MTVAEHPNDELAALHVTYDRDRVLFARWHNVWFGVWGRPADAQHAHALASAIGEHVRECPEGISTISVVLPDVSLPPAAERAATERVVRANARHFISVATVLMSSGFTAGALRSFLTSLYFFQTFPYKFRIFGSLREVAPWVVPIHRQRSGVRISASALDLVLQHVVARGLANREPALRERDPK